MQRLFVCKRAISLQNASTWDDFANMYIMVGGLNSVTDRRFCSYQVVLVPFVRCYVLRYSSLSIYLRGVV